MRESCSQDEAKGGVGGRNQSAALLVASAAPEAAALSCDCTPCDKTTPVVSTDANVADKRCPRPGLPQRLLGRIPTGANYPMSHARKRGPQSVVLKRLQT